MRSKGPGPIDTPPNIRLEEIFARAAALPAAERAAWLDEVCAGQPELRAEVEALLRSHEAGGFMKGAPRRPEIEAELARLKPEEAGERIGNYKLLEQIGEGGFGVVWVAEQEKPMRRRVALKIIKLGMDTKGVVARFEQERQALAMMDHPNIAKVFDAGATQHGRPFFVMELVRGIKITDYCDQANLSTADRLELFITVCQAVQHAHQKGIIHRDLKPSNILVTLHDGVPVPKVIDFGVAKATQQQRLTDLTIYTQFEQMIGTPLYMSPEQAEMSALDLDTRSDIYSLGVLLYELLVGRTPFDPEHLMKQGLDEIRRTIREQEPPKPSTALQTMVAELRTNVAQHRQLDPARIAKLLRGDLDWIVMKALEKDRTRRYETVNAFAADVRRFLTDKPVSAGPPSAGYRFRKFARRNKAAFGMASAIAVILVGATIVSVWQAVRATSERDAKEVARQDAEAISTFLTEVFQSPDPERDGRTITVAETLDRAVKKLDSELATQPARKVRLRETLRRTYRALGLPREAFSLAEKVRDYYLATFGREHPDTLGAMQTLVDSFVGSRDEARTIQEEVLALRCKVLGPEHPDTLTSMHNLAGIYFSAESGDPGLRMRGGALKMREEVLALRRKVLGAEHPDTLSAMENLARSYDRSDRHGEAQKMREKVLELRRKVLGPEHRETLAAMESLADSYSWARNPDKALKMREEALALRRKVRPDQPDTMAAMNNLAFLYELAGRWDQRVKILEEEVALYRKVRGPEHPDTINAMGNLAGSYSRAGRQDEALKIQEELRRKVHGQRVEQPEAFKLKEELLPTSRNVIGPEHPDTLVAMKNLANSYAYAGRQDQALKMEEEVLTLSRKVLGSEHQDTLAAMLALADSYLGAGKRDEEVKLREEVLTLRRKVLGPEHPDTLAAMQGLAKSYSDVGREDQALKMREEVLTLSLGPEHPNTLIAMKSLERSYGNAGRLDEVTKLREEVLNFKRKVFGPEHRETLDAMNDLALSLFHTAPGRRDEGLKMQEELLTLTRKVLGPEFALIYMSNLAGSYFVVGRRDEALKMREEVLTLTRKVYGPELANTFPVRSALNALAKSYSDAGRGDEALKLREESRTAEEKDRVEQERQENALPPLAEIQTKHLWTLRNRAHHLARRGRWKDAAADFRTALRLDPYFHYDWYRLAPLLLQIGDVEGYRKHRQAMLEKFQSAGNLNVLGWTIKASLVVPAESAELETVAKLADTAVNQGKEKSDLPYFQFLKALAKYRGGHFAESVLLAKHALEKPGVKSRDIEANATLAMAEERLNHRSEALAALAKADELARAWPNVDGSDPNVDFGEDWPDTLIGTFLLREAHALLSEK